MTSRYGQSAISGDDTVSSSSSAFYPSSILAKNKLQGLTNQQWAYLSCAFVFASFLIAVSYQLRKQLVDETDKIMLCLYYFVILVITVLLTHIFCSHEFTNIIPWHVFTVAFLWMIWTLYDLSVVLKTDMDLQITEVVGEIRHREDVQKRIQEAELERKLEQLSESSAAAAAATASATQTVVQKRSSVYSHPDTNYGFNYFYDNQNQSMATKLTDIVEPNLQNTNTYRQQGAYDLLSDFVN